MSKQNIPDKGEQHSSQSIQQQDLSSTSATAQLKPAIEQEKTRRVSRSRPLEVLHYEPGLSDQARHFVEGWHLLFFARTGSTHIQELRVMQQQENERDRSLLSYVQKVQAQYREHMAKSAQSHWESVQEQAVIAEIRYGGLSLIPGFWLPEEMELGLSLLPRTGARLPTDALTLVEHAQPAASRSLDVLLVAATESRTRAELATQHLGGENIFSRQKKAFTFSTPVVAGLAAFGTIGITAAAGGVTYAAISTACDDAATDAGREMSYVSGGALPTTRSLEEMVQQQAERVRSLGDAPSSSQLIEMRQQLFTLHSGAKR